MSGPVPPDVIEIRGIRGFGRHGVFDHERADGQEFVVDVRLELDTRPAAASDDLLRRAREDVGESGEPI